MRDFDIAARTFDHFRSFPRGVPEAIRDAVWRAAGNPQDPRVLDLGAGTGRIGRVFETGGDFYIGVDASFQMLREFREHQQGARLVQADGVALPFRDAAFDVVMLMQVLSGARGWRGLLQDVCRVLRPGGRVVVGQTAAPETGVDAQMKNALAAILEEMGIAAEQPRKRRGEALAWLQSAAANKTDALAAVWTVERTPRIFMERHQTGNRFTALPASAQQEALGKLAGWAESTFGSLDAAASETHRFELQTFEFR